MGILYPQQSGALNGRIPGSVQTTMGAKQRLRFTAATTLDHQNRFITGGAA